MRPRVEQPILILLLRELDAGRTLDLHRAAELTGLSVRNIRPYLKLLHDAKKTHILRWAFSGRGPRYPVYAAGECDDTPYPDTRLEKARRRRARRVMTHGLSALIQMGVAK